MTAREYLKHQAEMLTDKVSIQHKNNKCGQCAKLTLSARVAKRMLKKELPKNAIRVHSMVVNEKWKKSKFYKAYHRAVRLGKDPIEYMRSKGLEP